MGRIKTTLIKKTANKLYSENPEKCKKTFEENKEVVEELLTLQSKKFRNIIAGYITRLAKQQK